jgi:hypothetical protein
MRERATKAVSSVREGAAFFYGIDCKEQQGSGSKPTQSISTSVSLQWGVVAGLPSSLSNGPATALGLKLNMAA